MKRGYLRYANPVFAVAMLLVFAAASHAQNAIQDCEPMSMSKDKDRIGNTWTKPGVNLKQFNAIVIEKPGIGTLPTPAKFNYDDYARVFHANLMSRIQGSNFFRSVSANKSPAVSPDTLVLKSEVVELNPGSAAARWAVGFGAGRAAVGVKTSVLAGGKEVIMCWYGRRLGTSSLDSAGMLNQGMFKLSEDLNAYFNRVYNTGQ